MHDIWVWILERILSPKSSMISFCVIAQLNIKLSFCFAKLSLLYYEIFITQGNYLDLKKFFLICGHDIKSLWPKRDKKLLNDLTTHDFFFYMYLEISA